MIGRFYKSIVAWANDYFHSIWITAAYILLFALTFLCFLPTKSVSTRPHLLAIGDFLIVIRLMIPDNYARPVGMSLLMIGVLLWILTAPTRKKEYAKFQEGMRKSEENRREWERKNGIR